MNYSSNLDIVLNIIKFYCFISSSNSMSVSLQTIFVVKFLPFFMQNDKKILYMHYNMPELIHNNDYLIIKSWKCMVSANVTGNIYCKTKKGKTGWCMCTLQTCGKSLFNTLQYPRTLTLFDISQLQILNHALEIKIYLMNCCFFFTPTKSWISNKLCSLSASGFGKLVPHWYLLAYTQYYIPDMHFDWVMLSCLGLGYT